MQNEGGGGGIITTGGQYGYYSIGDVIQVNGSVVRVDSYLAQGGFAQVFAVLVVADPLKKLVLKRIHATDQFVLESCKNEVYFMQRLVGLDNIVEFENAAINTLPNNNGYEVLILMEYCAGGHLVDFLNTRLQSRLTEYEALHIFTQVCQAVSHLHSQKPLPIIHRDIKVENVLIATNGSFKLCDFGSATTRIIPAGVSMQVKEIHALSDEIGRVTTLQYRAPELCDLYQKLGMDEKVDIWALGVVLYKLCYFTTPFEESGQLGIVNAKYSVPSYPCYSKNLIKLLALIFNPSPKARPDTHQLIDIATKIKSRNFTGDPFECMVGSIHNNTTTDMFVSVLTPTSTFPILVSSPANSPPKLGQLLSGFPSIGNGGGGGGSEDQAPPPAMRRGRPPPKTTQQAVSSSMFQNIISQQQHQQQPLIFQLQQATPKPQFTTNQGGAVMSGTDLFSQTSSVSSSPGRLSATSRTVASEVSQAFDPFAVGLNQQQQQQQQVQSSPSSNLMRPPSQPTSAVMSGSSLDFGFLNGGGINNSGSVNINSHNSGSFNSLLNYDPFDPLAPSNVTSTTSRVSTSSYRTSNTHASYASDFLALDSASPPTKLLSRSATGLEEFSPLTSVAGAEAAAAVPLPASRQNSTQSSPAATMTGLGRTSPFYTPQMQQNQLQLNQYSSFTQIQLPAAAMPPPKPPRSNQNSFG